MKTALLQCSALYSPTVFAFTDIRYYKHNVNSTLTHKLLQHFRTKTCKVLRVLGRRNWKRWRFPCRLYLIVLLVRCAHNVACYNFVELNFLLKELHFPLSEEPAVLPAKLRGTGAMLSHTSHSPIKSSYLGCYNCNPLQKAATVDWPRQPSTDLALLWLTCVLLNCGFSLS